MLDSTRLLLFLTAAVLLAIAPGPGMLYVLARSLAGGKREGVLSALGTFLGGMVHVFAAALGVSIVLARSALAFSTVKYLGAAYLCFLGVRMIIDARRDIEKTEASSTRFLPRPKATQRAIRYGRVLQRKRSIPKQRCSFSPLFHNSSTGGLDMCLFNSLCWELLL